MLEPNSLKFATLPNECPPLLMVVVDTEEEFDWHRPHSRENRSVRSISAQYRAQDIFARYDITPTYVVDFPVANEDRAVKVLRDLADQQACHIGAHLHPWVNPPHEEDVNAYNSYPGNLPPDLEREKLTRLTEAIVQGFGRSPTAYRAGRYGLGPSTAGILEDLGYQVDTSVVPFSTFANDGGPDFERFGFHPYWFGSKGQLLEIPLSCGFSGILTGRGAKAYPVITRPLGMKLHLPGVCSRLGLLERIRLTPEGVDLSALVRLTGSLLSQGCKLFCLSYHSPSLEPGNTPYVRDKKELAEFLGRLDGYFDYFMRIKGGAPTTPAELLRVLRPESPRVARAS